MQPAFHDMDPMLTNSWTKHELPTSTRINLLGTFAQRDRIGKYTQDGGTRVKCRTVQVALHAIRVMFELDGKPNPMYHSEGWYWLAIERQLEGYRCENPLAQATWQCSSSKVVNHIHVIGNVKATEKTRAMGDMCLIAFYFLL
jgi:hypothetical protein